MSGGDWKGPWVSRRQDRHIVRVWVRTPGLHQAMMVLLWGGWILVGLLGWNVLATLFLPPVLIIDGRYAEPPHAFRTLVSVALLSRAALGMAGATLLLPLVLTRWLVVVVTADQIRVRYGWRWRTYDRQAVRFETVPHPRAALEHEAEAALQRHAQARGLSRGVRLPRLYRRSTQLLLWHAGQHTVLCALYKHGTTVQEALSRSLNAEA